MIQHDLRGCADATKLRRDVCREMWQLWNANIYSIQRVSVLTTRFWLVNSALGEERATEGLGGTAHAPTDPASVYALYISQSRIIGLHKLGEREREGERKQKTRKEKKGSKKERKRERDSLRQRIQVAEIYNCREVVGIHCRESECAGHIKTLCSCCCLSEFVLCLILASMPELPRRSPPSFELIVRPLQWWHSRLGW